MNFFSVQMLIDRNRYDRFLDGEKADASTHKFTLQLGITNGCVVSRGSVGRPHGERGRPVPPVPAGRI